jgi:low affinity Fe/Cu permease
MERRNSWFTRFARRTAVAMGKPLTFVLSLALVVVWGVCGPIFHNSDTWQLVINTATTVITFWMVFVIQSSQNRDTEAIQLKLDELIKAQELADNSMLDLELLEDKELDALREAYCKLANEKRAQRRHGRRDA